VNTWFVPRVATKPVDQSNATTTMVNDNDLIVAADANATYLFDCYVSYEGGSGGSSDFKWVWTVPSGASLRYHPVYQRALDNASVGGLGFAGATVVSARTQGSGNLCGASMKGVLTTGSSAGSIQLQWAAFNAAVNTIVHDHSYLSLRRTA
jgi:hypothetical protein